jgi:hypothetical protein
VLVRAKDTKIPKYDLAGILERMGSCESCNKMSVSLIEFNSVMLCPECFDREIQRMSAAIVEP